jgi:hypothetical protein
MSQSYVNHMSTAPRRPLTLVCVCVRVNRHTVRGGVCGMDEYTKHVSSYVVREAVARVHLSAAESNQIRHASTAPALVLARTTGMPLSLSLSVCIVPYRESRSVNDCASECADLFSVRAKAKAKV